MINEEVARIKGNLHSAQIFLQSLDFAPLEALLSERKWKEIEKILAKAAKNIENAGADFLVISTNTMHKLAKEIAEVVSIPLLHIADSAARTLVQEGIQSVGLPGTKATMEEDFYRKQLQENFSISCLVPEKHDRNIVHEIIFQELCRGSFLPASKQKFQCIIAELGNRGAEAVLLACAELGLLIQEKDIKLKIFDTAVLRAQAAALFACQPLQ